MAQIGGGLRAVERWGLVLPSQPCHTRRSVSLLVARLLMWWTPADISIEQHVKIDLLKAKADRLVGGFLHCGAVQRSVGMCECLLAAATAFFNCVLGRVLYWRLTYWSLCPWEHGAGSDCQRAPIGVVVGAGLDDTLPSSPGCHWTLLEEGHVGC